MLCSLRRNMCLRIDSQGRWVRQATVCRESGAADHQQVGAGAHVESFSMPYHDSFGTAAKQGNAPMRFDPWTRQCSASERPWQTSHVSAEPAASEGRQYCLPHVALRTARCGVLRQLQRSLASISALDLSAYLAISRGGRGRRYHGISRT